MAHIITCSRCHAKHDDTDEQTNTHFEYNKSNERFKTCIPCRENCRIKAKIYSENNKEKIRYYQQMYYELYKDKIWKYQKEHQHKKRIELNEMKANNEYDKITSNNTDITLHIDDIKAEHKIRLRFCANGYRFEKQKRI